MFVAVMAFHAQISDPSMGGTYMTLLNTFANMGGNWPSWLVLRFVSELTWKTCSNGNPCNTELDEKVSANYSNNELKLFAKTLV